jgi:hypothetical protein
MNDTLFTTDRTRLGAPPKGVAHVDATQGSALAKRRAKTLLLLVAGELTRARAAREMGVSVRRVRQLREAMLNSAVAALEPGQPGRPRKGGPSAAERRVRELEGTQVRLQLELEARSVREEIALIMPHLLLPDGGARGKARASRKEKARNSAGPKSPRG